MKIAIIGSGYVGLVTGSCLAELGNHVICADIDQKKIAGLKRGISPLYEPGLQELLTKNIKEKKLNFTDSSAEAIQKSDIIFNCVGTPLNNKNLPDTKPTFKVAELFANNLNKPKIFINKSTVPVGTTEKCKKIIQKSKPHIKFSVASNPEFLRQGTAVKDFMTPDRIVIGTEDKDTQNKLKKLYTPLIRAGKPLINTTIKSAELIKYAANSYIATKISFINEIAGYCEKTGIDIKDISSALGMDQRIGTRYLHAGIGYGGGCLPKDIKSLIELGNQSGHDFKILKQAAIVNEKQKKHFISKIIKTINPTNKIFAVWGLSYKPNTDDLRDSPSLEIINALIKKGAILQLFDPSAMPNAKKIFLPSKQIKYARTTYLAAKKANALIILTDWDEFRAVDYKKLKEQMKGTCIFDGRNIINSKAARKNGFKYTGIGNGTLSS